MSRKRDLVVRAVMGIESVFTVEDLSQKLIRDYPGMEFNVPFLYATLTSLKEKKQIEVSRGKGRSKSTHKVLAVVAEALGDDSGDTTNMEEPDSRKEIAPNLEKCSGGEDEALERRKEILGKAMDDIYGAWLDFSTENIALKDETRELRKQLQEKEIALLGQGEEIQLLESSKALFVKIAEQAEACLLELEDAEKLLALADRNIDELEKYVDVLESELLAFQDKKAILTEIHQLTAIFIPDLEPSMPEIATVTVNGDSHVRPALPVECNYYERPFFYSRKFMKVFEGLEKSDKVAIMESLEHYSQGGPGYSSLRSKKQEGCRKKGTIKGGEIKSRAGKFFRFSWEVKAEAVHITGLTRKSNIIE